MQFRLLGSIQHQYRKYLYLRIDPPIPVIYDAVIQLNSLLVKTSECLYSYCISFKWVCEKRILLCDAAGVHTPSISTIKPERVTLSRCKSPSPAILLTSSHLNMLWRFHLLWILLSRAGQFCSLFLELYRTAKPKHFAPHSLSAKRTCLTCKLN